LARDSSQRARTNGNSSTATPSAPEIAAVDSVTARDSRAWPSLIDRVFQQERINFTLTNRIPRRLVTLFVGWLSHIESPLLCRVALGIWQLFAGPLDLHESRKTRFNSLHDCFVRELKPGARPIDQAARVLVSPCDAIVGAGGALHGTALIQAKDSVYTLEELLDDRLLADRYRNGSFVTLRLTSTMYHRFHAPYECEAATVTYIPGDVWNVNPPALKRIERLFCRNERAILPLTLRDSSESIVLVPVAAILVASIHLDFVDAALNLKYRGPRRLTCSASFTRGQEMGHFRHGSTIIVIATKGLDLCTGLREGGRIQVGQPLFVHR
jgi:phosphatidylserine decarboxylase